MVSEDQRQQVSSYLRAQGTKLSTAELLAKRAAEVENLLASAAGLSEDEITWAPEGEWSTVCILQHMLESFAGYRRTISRTGRGVDLGDVPPDPPPSTVAALEAAIRAENEKTQALLKALGDAPADRWEASDFGDLNWREWALFERVHLLDHVLQIRALKERLDTPGR